MNNKIKIVLVCHFSNASVRKNLPLDNRKLYNIVRKCLGMPTKGTKYSDIASWNTNFIDNFRERDDVELVVVSAHSGLKRNVVNFQQEGVNYYFIKCDWATLLKRIIKSPQLWHKLNPMRPIVRKIVRNERPDIVALMGAENAYISGTILGLEKEYPIIFKAQTIYNNPDRGKHGIVDSKNAYVERLIFDAIPYASVTTKMHYKLYRQFNTTSYNFPWSFATTFPKCNEKLTKEYDFVNFAASMIDAKGYADAIRALAIVKKSYQNVKLNLVGSATPEVMKRYQELVSENGLVKNVIFTPSFERQEDVFKHIRKSHFAVLPYKLDYIASTTYQAMHYELPVVCYQTEGTPTLNEEKECVLIADMNNVEMLAEKMCLLLSDADKRELLRKNAKELVDKKNDGKRISDEIIAGFKAIVKHYNTGEEINSQLICNPLEHDN